MRETIHTPIKINLTLRILSRRSDGYHEIYSLFWQKKSIEQLTITRNCAEITRDDLTAEGISITGENLVTKALRAARALKPDIPPLAMSLQKHFPTGSGIGAGSGNAAALLKWLRARYGLDMTDREIGHLGADIAFLASDSEMSEARGVGEILTPAGQAPELAWTIAFPSWHSDTKAAYAKLDELRETQACQVLTEKEAVEESARAVAALKAGKCAGLLPNDFWDVLAGEHEEYLKAEDIASASGAVGWGLCGSGSAFFALSSTEDEARSIAEKYGAEGWIIKTIFMG